MAKKQVPVKINHAEKTIVINREFEKKQSDPLSEEFRTLCEIRAVFPEYEVVRKKVNLTKKREAYKGLTYEYMVNYIRRYGCVEDLYELGDMVELSKCHSIRYPVIKAWFFSKYPEVAEYGVVNDNALYAACGF